MTNSLLLERAQIVSGFAPASLTTARTGGVVSMKGWGRCAIIFHKGIGTAGQDPTITLLQGTSVAFSTNKPLNFTTIYVKQDPTSLADVGQWTTVTQAAANTYTDTDSAEQEAIWVIDVKAEDLDADNGYDCIRASISDVGTNSQLGSVLYVLYDPRYSAAPSSMPSAIVD